MCRGCLEVRRFRYYAVLSFSQNGKVFRPWIPLRLDSRQKTKTLAENFLQRLASNWWVGDDEHNDLLIASLGLSKKAKLHLNRTEKFELFPKAPSPRILLADYLYWWVERVKARLAETTISGYKGILRRYLVPYFRERRKTLGELTTQDVDSLIYVLLNKKKISPATVIRVRTLLYSAMKYAEKEGIVNRNVVALADRPKPDPHHFSVYDPDELRQLITRSKGDDLFIPVLLAASLGLRREEVLGLRWRNVSFKENYIAIESTVVECDQDGKMRVIAKEGMKTKSSWRRLPMPETLRNTLEAEKRRLAPNRDERLCKRSDGSDTTPGFVSSHFPILLKRLRLPLIRFHDLRHSLATAMRAKGTDMSLIQHWLGHSLITTTESIYAHFDARMLKPALENVNQILGLERGQEFKE